MRPETVRTCCIQVKLRLWTPGQCCFFCGVAACPRNADSGTCYFAAWRKFGSQQKSWTPSLRKSAPESLKRKSLCSRQYCRAKSSAGLRLNTPDRCSSNLVGFWRHGTRERKSPCGSGTCRSLVCCSWAGCVRVVEADPISMVSQVDQRH